MLGKQYYCDYKLYTTLKHTYSIKFLKIVEYSSFKTTQSVNTRELRWS